MNANEKSDFYKAVLKKLSRFAKFSTHINSTDFKKSHLANEAKQL